MGSVASKRSHGWARATRVGPAPAVLGRGIRAYPKKNFFLGGGEYGVDGRRTWQQNSQKSIWQLQSVYIWQVLGASPQTPTGAPPVDPAGDFRPQTLCTHQSMHYAAWFQSLSTPLGRIQ